MANQNKPKHNPKSAFLNPGRDAIAAAKAEAAATTAETQRKEPAKGFEWISNIATEPYVTIDSHYRLYISKAAREMLDLPSGSHFRLIAGYDHINHRIVLAKPEVVRVPNVKSYNFDKRSYSRVRHYVDKAGLANDLPIRFIYAGRDYSEYPAGAHVFERAGHVAEDR